MKKKSIFMKGCAAALVAVMALGLGAISYAAVAVDANAASKLTVTVADGAASTYATELTNVDIPVNLYKVATIDASGHYKSETAFSSIGLETIDDTTADWEAKALAAYAIVSDKNNPVAPTETFTKAGETSAGAKDGNAEGSIDLTGKQGMYLVVAGKDLSGTKIRVPEGATLYPGVETEEYYYTFKPYLISVPTNNWASETSIDPNWEKNKSDAWIYDVKVSLKPEAQEKLGDLWIIKDLLTFNTTNSSNGATFVFEVVATKNGKVVYENTESITMHGAGITNKENATDWHKPIIIKDLPVNAVVNVKETYPGSCYELKSSSFTLNGKDHNPFSIVADTHIDATFVNDWDKTDIGGVGVKNHFAKKDGENGSYYWDWEPDDPTVKINDTEGAK